MNPVLGCPVFGSPLYTITLAILDSWIKHDSYIYINTVRDVYQMLKLFMEHQNDKVENLNLCDPYVTFLFYLNFWNGSQLPILSRGVQKDHSSS